MKVGYWKLFRILIEDKKTVFFFLMTVLGLAFSMTVILCNFGLMDGYEVVLKNGLRKSMSDLEITSRYGFFKVNSELKEALKDQGIQNYAGVVKTEGFIVQENKSKGVLIYGIDEKEYNSVSSIAMKIPNEDSLVIGKTLAEELDVKQGDKIVIAFTRGNKNFEDLPYLKPMTISDIFSTGIYRKDMRIVYMHREGLRKFANTDDRVNSILLKLDGTKTNDDIEKVRSELARDLPFGYKIKAYWNEFQSLFEAVQVEKFSITVILQLIIVIALFNIVAFVNFNTTKKSQEFFLLRALGMSLKAISKFWILTVFMIWLLSCFFSLVMTWLFDKVILKLPFLKIPGNIYELYRLELSLSFKSVLMVFALTLIWSIGVIAYILLKERKKTLLQGLRQEFS
ncbi:MAG: ABC transporter permease [Halobacteriovoraceae bacterium]|nr:ABC transporter permease [Halobacteriovoraceae bacterium]MCB9095484.1 ABC transporter permease [Halobacteriovoraceae bacterium]